MVKPTLYADPPCSTWNTVLPPEKLIVMRPMREPPLFWATENGNVVKPVPGDRLGSNVSHDALLEAVHPMLQLAWFGRTSNDPLVAVKPTNVPDGEAFNVHGTA